jgi:hypothetical protein
MGAGHSGSVLVQFGSAGQPVPKLFDVSIAGTNVRGRGCLRYTGSDFAIPDSDSSNADTDGTEHTRSDRASAGENYFAEGG